MTCVNGSPHKLNAAHLIDSGVDIAQYQCRFLYRASGRDANLDGARVEGLCRHMFVLPGVPYHCLCINAFMQ